MAGGLFILDIVLHHVACHGGIRMIDFIVCNYNGKHLIRDCLDSIKKQSHKGWNCIVVDDCSTDGSVEFLEKEYPWVKVITKPANSGPSISRNMGIKSSKGEYIAILDNDVVLDKDWLKEQLLFLKDHTYCGIVGSKLVYAMNTKKLNASYGGLFTLGIGYDGGCGKPAKTFAKAKQCMYVCSAAMLMRRSMVEEIGAFDDTYFYGHEDTDLGWRANIAGYSVWSNPHAVAKHKHSETMKHYSNKLYYHSRKNYLRSVLKNYQWWNVLWAGPLLKLFIGLDIIIRPHRWAKLKGMLWNMGHIGSTLRARRKVQKTRKVSDKGLWKLFTHTRIRKLAGF